MGRELNEENLISLCYILLESTNFAGLTIDEKGILACFDSQLKQDEYRSFFKLNLSENNFWLTQDFLSDQQFIAEIKSKSIQMKNPSFRANIIGQRNYYNNAYLEEHHPFGIHVLPLITSFYV